jgi:hypothetical protein
MKEELKENEKSVKNTLNTIFRGGSLILKGGLTIGIGIIGAITLFISAPWLSADNAIIQFMCGGTMLLITFVVGLMFLMGAVWTLQDLIGWTR